MTQSNLQSLSNPSTPKISLVILVTVCHTNFVILVWRIELDLLKMPKLKFFFSPISCLFNIVSIF